jgi:tetratricopeptide (TPR) repeat protein
MMRVRARFLVPVLALSLPAAGLFSQSQPAPSPAAQRAQLHRSDLWLQIEPHLPNPDTASAAALETAGDVLRARRFPEDALDYYGYALAKGADPSKIRNKMGVVRLDLHEAGLARAMFQEAIKLDKDDAPAWNNLGVTEAMQKNFQRAISDYKKAVKLDSVAAVYHANAGMALFELKDLDPAREQLTAAIQIDPEVLQRHSEAGINAEILGRDNYGALCFEMAELFAGMHNVVEVRLWLSKANGSGYDVRQGLRDDAAMHAYLKDPEVQLMLASHATVQKRAITARPAAPGATQQMNMD